MVIFPSPRPNWSPTLMGRICLLSHQQVQPTKLNGGVTSKPRTIIMMNKFFTSSAATMRALEQLYSTLYYLQVLKVRWAVLSYLYQHSSRGKICTRLHRPSSGDDRCWKLAQFCKRSRLSRVLNSLVF